MRSLRAGRVGLGCWLYVKFEVDEGMVVIVVGWCWVLDC